MSTQKTGRYGLALDKYPEITIGTAETTINHGEKQYHITPSEIKVGLDDTEYVDLEVLVESYLKHRQE